MLPATATRLPARAISIAAIAVVVVLPLVPVIMTTSRSAANSLTALGCTASMTRPAMATPEPEPVNFDARAATSPSAPATVVRADLRDRFSLMRTCAYATVHRRERFFRTLSFKCSGVPEKPNSSRNRRSTKRR